MEVSENGVRKILTVEDDKLIAHSEQDVEPIVRDVQRLRDAPVSSEFKLAAVIPMPVVERMMQEGSWNDPAAMKRWLNDPQNDCFRVWRGKL